MKMCEKLRYCAREIDPCLVTEINKINEITGKGMKTIASCCGHGKYPPTIVLLRVDGWMLEWFSKQFVGMYNYKKKKQYNRIYKKDKSGYYFIPELLIKKD
jgi:hypothetical protein